MRYPRLEKRKDNGVFYIRYSRTRRESLGVRDRALAKELFAERKRLYDEGKIKQIGRGLRIRLSEFRKEYIKERSMMDLAPGTLFNDERSLRMLEEVVGDIPLRMLTPRKREDFKSILLGQGRRKTYINMFLSSLRAAFNWAIKEDEDREAYLDKNPFAGRGVLFRVDETIPRFLDLPELEALFKAIDDEDFLMAVETYLRAGLRRSELIRLQGPDFDLRNDFIYVRGTKSKKDRAVPISSILKAKLLKWGKLPDIGPVFPRWREPSSISNKFKKYADKAGIKARLHDMRHTFASYLAIEGVDLLRIKELLGHSNIATTQIYAKVRKEHLVDAVNRINFGGSE